MEKEMFQAVIAFGQATIRNLILINGGACVAMLALIGGIFDKAEALARSLSSALLFFGGGVLLGALAAGASYISQSCYYYDEDNKRGDIWRWGCIGIGVASYVAFAGGCLVTFMLIKQ